MVYDVERMPVIDISKLDRQKIRELEKSLDQLSKRDLGSIFDEVEAKDHQALDEIIFDIFGLSREERIELYSSLKDLVTERATKAKSVKTKVNGNGKRKKEKKENEENGPRHMQETLFSFSP